MFHKIVFKNSKSYFNILTFFSVGHFLRPGRHLFSFCRAVHQPIFGPLLLGIFARCANINGNLASAKNAHRVDALLWPFPQYYKAKLGAFLDTEGGGGGECEFLSRLFKIFAVFSVFRCF